MTQQEWTDLVSNQIDINTVDGQMMKCLAQLPELMHRGRHVIWSMPLNPDTLSGIREEVQLLRVSFAPILDSLRERWLHTDSNIAAQYPDFMAHRAIIHAHYSRSYGLALAIGIILNCMSSTLEGSDKDFSRHSEELSDEVVNLAEVAAQYRPLGTIYMVLSLAAAWVGVKAPAKKAAIEALLISYVRDLQGPSAKPSLSLAFFEKRFTMM